MLKSIRINRARRIIMKTLDDATDILYIAWANKVLAGDTFIGYALIIVQHMELELASSDDIRAKRINNEVRAVRAFIDAHTR